MRNVADLAAVPFQIPEIAVAAPRDLVLKQAAGRAEAGAAWKENDLVFCTRLGGQLRVPPRSRSVRRSRANQRPTEAKTDP